MQQPITVVTEQPADLDIEQQHAIGGSAELPAICDETITRTQKKAKRVRVRATPFEKAGRVVINTLTDQLGALTPHERRELMKQTLEFLGTRLMEFDARSRNVEVTEARCALCQKPLLAPVPPPTEERKLVTLY